MSQEFTVYQATNPATPPETLARMAAARPDLRQFVAANPATPPSVVESLATLGDHAVDAALARRRPAPSQQPATFPPPARPNGPPAAPPTHRPAGPPSGAPATRPWTPTAPPAQAPANPYAPPRPTPVNPYTPRAQANPYAPPAQGHSTGNAYAQPHPSATNPYAPPSGSSATYGPAGSYGQPYGAPAPVTGSPQDAYGYQLPEPGGRRTGLIVAIAVGAVLVLGALVFAATTIFGSLGQSDSTYGEDPHLDRLWDRCEGGDGQACDDLYLESPLNSGYEDFGDTCGNRFPPQQVWCVEVM